MEKEPNTSHEASPEGDETGRDLPPAARRALDEARQRRREGTYDPDMPEEKGGRDGPEPIRYGDWEKNGIASDF